MKNLKQKFTKAINSGRLKLEGGKKNWYNYILDIQELVWSRNFIDGYNIYLFDKNMCQLIEINIDNNLGKINFKITLKNDRIFK
ncbi:MAG: hypothetical protein Q9M94_02590 [Candidatus Gracilibacteria bacterium]|nr:hypothetical protein [Candidatus Gracilibacteria bacterium]MDQ7022667.1 hypothetical protein [Candidatus Gracilibacteria bacterium]